MGEPEWFHRALEANSEKGRVSVAGCGIGYETWGQPGLPGVVLVHGSNANREWWRFVAPFLADQFHVAAFDLSGNGDSGWRPEYTGERFAAEVMGVIEAAGLDECESVRPAVVGHSFGGYVALEAGYRYGSDLAGVLFCDYTVCAPHDWQEWGRKAEGSGPARPTRVYPELETALGRFRLLPDQPARFPAVHAHIARTALREVEGGWTWKFDPSLFDTIELGDDQHEKYLAMRCRSALILGEHSTDEGAQSADYMVGLTAGRLAVMELPGTHHHFMFEEPVATVVGIKAVLHGWRIAELEENR
tara:strand:- start:155 stop:1063 length:909 start_codon:yes stop_codon:yes gene_type:complete